MKEHILSIHLHDYQHNRIASNCIAEHDVSLIDARETVICEDCLKRCLCC